MAAYWFKQEYQKGLVSVIIPSHNQDRYLSATLASLAAQEYRPIEVIIVDDGSTDETGHIMNDFQGVQREGIAVKCIYQSKQGAPYARNQGCRQSQGEFIQFLDSDDILFNEKLSQQVTLLQNDTAIDLVYGDGQYLVDDGDNEKKGRVIEMGVSSDIIESLLFGYWVPSFSYLCRRSAVQLNGPWDESLPVLQDFEYFLRMAIKGCRFYYKPGITGLYRKHSAATLSEKSVAVSCRMRRHILVQAELYLKRQSMLSERRARAMAEYYRRIARQAYTLDMECFRDSLDDVLRICPQYSPQKTGARLISRIIGFRNYEKLAAMISHMIHIDKTDWY